MSYSPRNFGICVCHESEDCVFPGYHFFTAGGNIKDSNFKYFCITNKKTSHWVNQIFFMDFVYSSSVDRSSIKLILCHTALKLNIWIIFFEDKVR